MIAFFRKIIPQDFFLRRWYSIINAHLAALYYGYPARRMQTIGITGTDGKTTTTELIAHILRKTGKRVFSITTARVQMDRKLLPTDKRTTPNPWKIQKLLHEAVSEGIDFLAIEVSSHALSQSRVYGILFDVCVLTNITPEHLDYHHTFVEYQKSKKTLFTKYMKPRAVAVLNTQDPAGRAWSREFLRKGKKVSTYSMSDEYSANWHAERISIVEKGVRFHLQDKIRQSDTAIFLPMYGIFNVDNAMAAMLAVLHFGIDVDESGSLLEDFSGVQGRMEEVDMGQDFFVFVDFAVTPAALQKILDAAEKMAGSNKTHLVFGSHGSRYDPDLRREIGRIAAAKADRIIVTDDEPYFENPTNIRMNILDGIWDVFNKNEEGYRERVQEIADRKIALQTALQSAKKGDVVLISGMGHLGSRNIAGEEVKWNDVDVVRNLLESMGYKGEELRN